MSGKSSIFNYGLYNYLRKNVIVYNYVCRESFNEMLGIDFNKTGKLIDPTIEKGLQET